METHGVPTTPVHPERPAAHHPPPPSFPAYPPWQYGYPRVAEPTNSLTAGAALAMLGGLRVGIGWMLPTDNFWIVLGIGWLLFGPGIGLALLGMGKQRLSR